MRAAPGLEVLGARPPVRAALQPTQPAADGEHKNIVISLITSMAERSAGARLGELARGRKDSHGSTGRGSASPQPCPCKAHPCPSWDSPGSPSPGRDSPFPHIPCCPWEICSRLTPWLVGSTGEELLKRFEPLQGCWEWAAPPRRAVTALWLGSPRVSALLSHPSTAQGAGWEDNRARGMLQPRQ